MNAMHTTNILASRAMLANLTISGFSARKLDKRITAEVNESHNASADAGRYNKATLSPKALDEVNKAARAARELHYSLTSPWLDEGARILAAKGFERYRDGMARLRQDYESAVERFLSERYPAEVAAAPARLNGMFRAEDYPSVDELRERFGFAVRMFPVPDANDFRCDIADEQADVIRAEIERSTKDALNVAMRDAWERVVEVMGRMVDRLKAYRPPTEETRAQGTFHGTLVTNVRDLADVLPMLNLTNDARLSAIADRMRELGSLDAETLRENDGLRANTAATAEAILGEASLFLA